MFALENLINLVTSLLLNLQPMAILVYYRYTNLTTFFSITVDTISLLALGSKDTLPPR